MQLQDSKILITGAAKRIGRTLALDLASRGAKLFLHCHRSARDAQKLKAEIEKKYHHEVFLFQADLSKLPQLKKMAEEVWKISRGLDGLINNASTFYPTKVGKLREVQWEDLFAINAKAPYFLSEYLGLKMKKRGRGKIINIADWAALRPYADYIPYSASKSALLAITQGMAKALAPAVQVNAILPGTILWPEGFDVKLQRDFIAKTPLKRIGNSEEMASAVRFFIENDFATGSFLHLDGGRHLV